MFKQSIAILVNWHISTGVSTRIAHHQNACENAAICQHCKDSCEGVQDCDTDVALSIIKLLCMCIYIYNVYIEYIYYIANMIPR